MSATKDFIKDYSYLKEDYRQLDGLARFHHIDLVKYIDGIERTCVVALVGPYGSGKSTALYHAQQKLEDDTKWLQFDAWRYPERKALWDGLIIEVAKQLGSLKKVTPKLDGNQAALGKWGGVTTGIFASLVDFMPKGAMEWVGEKIPFIDSSSGKAKEIKEAGVVADNLANNLFGRSAAKRTYEFEKILTDLLASTKESRIILVAEDIDRSGTDGLHFLETLSFYLNNTQKFEKKKIIVIAPIGDKHFRERDDLYLKCVDYVEFFRPSSVNLNEFIDRVFNIGYMYAELAVEMREMRTALELYQIKYFLESLFNNFPQQMNMRKLKMIIRETATACRLMRLDGHEPHWILVLCVQAMKYLKDESVPAENPLPYFDVYNQTKRIDKTSPFHSTISAIADMRRQVDEPRYAAANPGTYTFGERININPDFSSGSIPKSQRILGNRNGSYRWDLQGYYFNY